MEAGSKWLKGLYKSLSDSNPLPQILDLSRMYLTFFSVYFLIKESYVRRLFEQLPQLLFGQL